MQNCKKYSIYFELPKSFQDFVFSLKMNSTKSSLTSKDQILDYYILEEFRKLITLVKPGTIKFYDIDTEKVDEELDLLAVITKKGSSDFENAKVEGYQEMVMVFSKLEKLILVDALSMKVSRVIDFPYLSQDLSFLKMRLFLKPFINQFYILVANSEDSCLLFNLQNQKFYPLEVSATLLDSQTGEDS